MVASASSAFVGAVWLVLPAGRINALQGFFGSWFVGVADLVLAHLAVPRTRWEQPVKQSHQESPQWPAPSGRILPVISSIVNV